MDENIRIARTKDPIWFLHQVPNKGPWDYKQDKRNNYQAFGNFNFGAAGRVVPILAANPEWLYHWAGWAQTKAHPGEHREFGRFGVPFLPGTGTRNYGDDPQDQFWISQGVRYQQYASGRK